MSEQSEVERLRHEFTEKWCPDPYPPYPESTFVATLDALIAAVREEERAGLEHLKQHACPQCIEILERTK